MQILGRRFVGENVRGKIFFTIFVARVAEGRPVGAVMNKGRDDRNDTMIMNR